MTRNPVGWFEIYVQDMPRAKTFYETIFQLKLSKLDTPAPDMEMWQFPSQEGAWGASGALAKMKGGPSGGGASTIVYFMSEDCAVEAGRVEAAGGSVMKPKFSIGRYGHIALVADPEGNVIGIHSMK